MGFFSSSQTSTSTYSNPTLAAYMETFRKTSPWSFAMYDPTATEAALAQGGAESKDLMTKLGTSGVEMVKGQAERERKLQSANDEMLQRTLERQRSGEFLTPQESDFINQQLDKAFEYATTTGIGKLKEMAEFSAGGRGLRMSDTPVLRESQRATQELMLGLGSERARLGLGATLDWAKTQQAFEEGFREFNESLSFNKRQAITQQLFGGGLQGMANIGYTQTQKTANSPSTLSSIMQSMSALQQGIDLVGQVGGGYAGFMSPNPSSGWGALRTQMPSRN